AAAPRPPGLRDAGRPAVAGLRSGLLCSPRKLRNRRNRALDASALVDAVGLLTVGHPAGYGSREARAACPQRAAHESDGTVSMVGRPDLKPLPAPALPGGLGGSVGPHSSTGNRMQASPSSRVSSFGGPATQGSA